MNRRLRIAFFGSPEFAVPTLRQLSDRHDVVGVVTQPDKPAGRGKALTAPPVKASALTLDIPVTQPATLKDPAVAAWLTGLRADVFVVVAYGRILPPGLLGIPRLGPWNLHASLLPKLRGAAPIQWSIINGDSVTGICVMQMEAGLDTGAVLARAETPIDDNDTAATLSLRLSEVGARLMLDTLPQISDGLAHAQPQDAEQATVARLLKKDDGWLDFRASAKAVSAHARGVDPWPGAMAIFGGEPVKLFVPTVVAGEGSPGEILGATAQGLVVACGSQAVAFGELQLPGRKRLGAAAVLAGRAIPKGSHLSRGILPL